MIKLAAEFETDGETSSMATLSMAVLGLGILAARCMAWALLSKSDPFSAPFSANKKLRGFWRASGTEISRTLGWSPDPAVKKLFMAATSKITAPEASQANIYAACSNEIKGIFPQLPDVKIQDLIVWAERKCLSEHLVKSGWWSDHRYVSNKLLRNMLEEANLKLKEIMDKSKLAMNSRRKNAVNKKKKPQYQLVPDADAAAEVCTSAYVRLAYRMFRRALQFMRHRESSTSPEMCKISSTRSTMS